MRLPAVGDEQDRLPKPAGGCLVEGLLLQWAEIGDFLAQKPELFAMADARWAGVGHPHLLLEPSGLDQQICIADFTLARRCGGLLMLRERQRDLANRCPDRWSNL